jgi:hypothetical protein
MTFFSYYNEKKRKTGNHPTFCSPFATDSHKEAEVEEEELDSDGAAAVIPDPEILLQIERQKRRLEEYETVLAMYERALLETLPKTLADIFSGKAQVVELVSFHPLFHTDTGRRAFIKDLEKLTRNVRVKKKGRKGERKESDKEGPLFICCCFYIATISCNQLETFELDENEFQGIETLMRKLMDHMKTER